MTRRQTGWSSAAPQGAETGGEASLQATVAYTIEPRIQVSGGHLSLIPAAERWCDDFVEPADAAEMGWSAGGDRGAGSTMRVEQVGAPASKLA